MQDAQDNATGQITGDAAHYEAFGWRRWPEPPWRSCQAEFFLQPDDPRRLATFTPTEQSIHGYRGHLNPPGEILDVPYQNGATMPASIVRAPFVMPTHEAMTLPALRDQKPNTGTPP